MTKTGQVSKMLIVEFVAFFSLCHRIIQSMLIGGLETPVGAWLAAEQGQSVTGQENRFGSERWQQQLYLFRSLGVIVLPDPDSQSPSRWNVPPHVPKSLFQHRSC